VKIGVLALQEAPVGAGTREAIAGIVAIAIERQQLLDRQLRPGAHGAQGERAGRKKERSRSMH